MLELSDKDFEAAIINWCNNYCKFSGNKELEKSQERNKV